MKKKFGNLHSGEEASLYTIENGGITATVTDLGATLVSLLVPDAQGNLADVVLGFDDPNLYVSSGSFLGATVGRNANRLRDAEFTLGNKRVSLTPNENNNNLHSGPDFFKNRLWTLEKEGSSEVTFSLESPNMDQGFPGDAHIRVTYALDGQGGLHVRYWAKADQDTVFNMTNHSYFNLAGHQHPDLAVHQVLSMPARHFCPDDAQNIPTGALRDVAGSPMDFRVPKPIAQDLNADYDALKLQGGYDHNWEVFCNPCATLTDPASGRCLCVYTDCPGIQFYSGNYLNDQGKDGVYYGRNSGMALETQFYPDCLHNPTWAQPITKANTVYKSETVYRFSCK